MSGELDDLEALSIVALVAREISNHIGVNDKTLAEFLVSLYDECNDVSEFKRNLSIIGFKLPRPAIDNIHRYISRSRSACTGSDLLNREDRNDDLPLTSSFDQYTGSQRLLPKCPVSGGNRLDSLDVSNQLLVDSFPLLEMQLLSYH